MMKRKGIEWKMPNLKCHGRIKRKNCHNIVRVIYFVITVNGKRKKLFYLPLTF